MAHSERSNACERYATKKGLGWEQWRSLEVAHSSDAIPNGSNPFTKMLRCKRTTCATYCLAVVSRNPKMDLSNRATKHRKSMETHNSLMEGAAQKTRNKPHPAGVYVLLPIFMNLYTGYIWLLIAYFQVGMSLWPRFHGQKKMLLRLSGAFFGHVALKQRICGWSASCWKMWRTCRCQVQHAMDLDVKTSEFGYRKITWDNIS